MVEQNISKNNRGLRHFRQDLLETEYIEAGPLNYDATIYGPHVDGTKRQVAFGRWAIPKIRAELLHGDLTIARQALVSLLDFAHDPEKAQEIIKLNVLARLVRMLVSEDDFIRYHTLLVLNVLATQPNGAQAIIDKVFIIKNLLKVISDESPKIRKQAAITIETLAKSVFAFSCLMDNEFDQNLVERVQLEEDIDVLISVLSALEAFMNNSGKATCYAIEKGLCEKISVYLSHESAEARLATLKVLQHMLMKRSGKLAAENCSTDMILELTNLLEDDSEDIVQEAAMDLALLFITTKNKLRGADLSTDQKLLFLAINSKNVTLKMNVMQALINLAVAPAVKERLKSHIHEFTSIDKMTSQKITELLMRLIDVIHQL
ncbi:hypothetical protein LSTR_LSTR011658 [Laodelphax striatellus]|uniref:Rhabdoid tumor deletion region protein 1 n=1 Tax=Laodelphax striatellus TaxID=195883 RepID=A0A482WKV9_LAOST|nr:hypothetical protein LSTR_LSTR011658 [Laodelphax striatellus]